MSIAGGLPLACERGAALGCETIQIFVKNERQWKGRDVPKEEVKAFREARKAAGITFAIAHDTYLINLASVDKELWRKSIDAFVDEMKRCEALGLEYLVTHPGAPGKAGEEAGIRNMIRALNEIHRKTARLNVRILLETTAGQGTVLGWRFEQMRAILDGLQQPDRLGFCFDTCHVFAAGYDISTRKGYEQTMKEFDRVLGLDRLQAFHVNDSKKGLGCRVDRHENIGKGAIGIEAFRCLMRDARFRAVPKVLETPKENDMDIVNLRLLRRLAGVK